MNSKYKVLAAIMSIALFLILSGVAQGQQSVERIESGNFTLVRAATPEYLITGVNLDVLSQARLSNMKKITEGLAGQFGRSRTLFDAKTKEQIRITVAVYGSVGEAEDAALELLNSVSVVMDSGTQSGVVVGIHSWYGKSPNGSGTVVFVHNNSLFQIFSPDYTLAESTAHLIVGDLSQGLNGVTLGRKVLLPKVTEVNVPKILRKNETASLMLKGKDPAQRALSYFAQTSKGQLLDTDRWDRKSFIPRESGVDKLYVYAINDANVVSRVFIKELTVEDQK